MTNKSLHTFRGTTEINGMNTRKDGYVIRRLQKAGRDGTDTTWRGRAFQVRAAVIGKKLDQRRLTAVYGG